MKHLHSAVGRLVLVAALVPALVPAALAGPAEDGFIAGYAAAILEREFRVEGAVVSVRDGVITLAGARLPAPSLPTRSRSPTSIRSATTCSSSAS